LSREVELRYTQLPADLARSAERLRRRAGIPGIAIGVLHRGAFHASGLGTVAVGSDVSVDEHTIFHVGSTTKTYTATALCMLADRGELDLDVPIRRYVPRLRLRQGLERRLTVRHLLTHTGGLDGDVDPSLGGRNEDALERLAHALARAEPVAPLGQVVHYSNAGFIVAGHVLERVAGKPYDEAIRDLLLVPLGMDQSHFFAEDVVLSRVAAGHLLVGGTANVRVRWGMPRASWPAAGLSTSVLDQLLWAQFHLSLGRRADGRRHASARAIRAMIEPHARVGCISDRVGLSWFLRDHGGAALVEHGGTVAGQCSLLTLSPSDGLAIAVLTNSEDGTRVARRIVDLALERFAGRRAAHASPLRLPPDELRRCVGSYSGSELGRVTVAMRGGELRVRFALEREAPARLVFVESDVAVAMVGRNVLRRIVFVRRRGEVAWIRAHGRLAAREPGRRPARSARGSRPGATVPATPRRPRRRARRSAGRKNCSR
jgi:CubicO group peptidase (beta-lactamase class C family)